MARKLRLEYADGLYHVINRGNYRRDVFESAGAVGSFEEALAEGRAEGVRPSIVVFWVREDTEPCGGQRLHYSQ